MRWCVLATMSLLVLVVLWTVTAVKAMDEAAALLAAQAEAIYGHGVDVKAETPPPEIEVDEWIDATAFAEVVAVEVEAPPLDWRLARR